MNRRGVLSLLSCVLPLAAIGCGGPATVSDTPPASRPGDPLAYTMAFPADLPSGGHYKDKLGFSQGVSRERIESDYSHMHREGWTDCLRYLDGNWNLDRRPLYIAQVWSWYMEGYNDGCRQCLSLVTDLQARQGKMRAQALVHEAVSHLPADDGESSLRLATMTWLPANPPADE